MRVAIEKIDVEHAASTTAPHVTLSLGVATMTPDDATNPSALLSAADEALYEAKKGGRNRACGRDLTADPVPRAELRKPS
jgi:diguanylate cyclase (GGDEF)-like protein